MLCSMAAHSSKSRSGLADCSLPYGFAALGWKSTGPICYVDEVGVLANPSPTCFTYQARAATSGNSVVPCFIQCGERPGRQMDATLSPVLTVSPAFHVWDRGRCSRAWWRLSAKDGIVRLWRVSARLRCHSASPVNHTRRPNIDASVGSALLPIVIVRGKGPNNTAFAEEAAPAQLHKPIPDALEGARGTRGMGDAASPEKGGKRHRTGPMLRRGIRRWARARDSRHE